MRAAAYRFTVVTLFGVSLLMWPGTSPAADDAGASKAATTSPTTQSGDENGPSKFYGTISAVDAKAKTFTIDGQTFAVVGDSHLTKAADGSEASIADATVGETARGTYTKSADGKLSVTKARFGKKTGGSGGGGGGGKKAKAGATTKQSE